MFKYTLLKNLLFIGGMLLIARSAEASHSLLHTDIQGSSPISRHKTGQRVSAGKRLKLIQWIFKKNPKFSISTPHPEIRTLFNLDIHFFENKLPTTRTKGQKILKEIKEFNAYFLRHMVQNKHELTMAEYNTVAYVWVMLLSNNASASYIDRNEELKKKNRALGETKYAFADLSEMKYLKKIIHSSNIPMPVVSRTGIVSAKTINEGFGIFTRNPDKATSIDYLDAINKECLEATSIDFLAVGTHKKHDFDYLVGLSSYYAWYHDFEHTDRYKHFEIKEKGQRKKAIFDQKYATLKQKIGKEILEKKISKLQEGQLELAIFMQFHERQGLRPGKSTPFYEDLKTRIEKYEEKLSKFKVAKHFKSLIQYKSYNSLAKSLGLKIEQDMKTSLLNVIWTKKDEKTPENIKTIRQYITFKRNYLSGMKLLLKYAPVYDECNASVHSFKKVPARVWS